MMYNQNIKKGDINMIARDEYLSILKRFKDKELINKEKDFSKIEMISQKKDRDINVKFEMKEKKKKNNNSFLCYIHIIFPSILFIII